MLPRTCQLLPAKEQHGIGFKGCLQLNFWLKVLLGDNKTMTPLRKMYAWLTAVLSVGLGRKILPERRKYWLSCMNASLFGAKIQNVRVQKIYSKVLQEITLYITFFMFFAIISGITWKFPLPLTGTAAIPSFLFSILTQMPTTSSKLLCCYDNTTTTHLPVKDRGRVKRRVLPGTVKLVVRKEYSRFVFLPVLTKALQSTKVKLQTHERPSETGNYAMHLQQTILYTCSWIG